MGVTVWRGGPGLAMSVEGVDIHHPAKDLVRNLWLRPYYGSATKAPGRAGLNRVEGRNALEPEGSSFVRIELADGPERL